MKKKASLIALCALSLTAACVLAGCGASLDREIIVQDMIMKVPSNWIEASDAEGSALDIAHLEAPGIDAANAPLPNTDSAGIEIPDGNGANAATQSIESGDASQTEANGLEASGSEALDSPATTNTPSSGKSGKNVVYLDIDEDNDDEYNAISIAYLPLTESPAKSAQEAIALKQLQAQEEYGVISWDIDKEKSNVIDGAQVTKFEYSFEKEIDHMSKKYEYKTIYVFTPSTCYEISVYGNAVSVDDVVNSLEF